MTTLYLRASDRFERAIATATATPSILDDLPEPDALQIRLTAWEARQPFWSSSVLPVALGVGEECGELAEAKSHAEATDAVGDIAIYVCQVATRERLAMSEILAEAGRIADRALAAWPAAHPWRTLMARVGRVNHLALKRHRRIREGALPDAEYRALLADALAEKLCRTPLVGTVYRGKPADAAVAILYGAELGLNPLQSLQQVFTVHGTPAIYARTMGALLKRRGFRFQTMESTDEQVTVTGTSPIGDVETSTWTIERATRAGYVPQIDDRTGKYAVNANGKLIGNEKYITDPQAMLYAKALAEVSRRLAPDVLLGISRTYEDVESEPAPAVRVESERVTVADILGDSTGQDQPVTVVEWVEETPETSEKPDVEQPAGDPPVKPAKASTATQQKKIARLLDERGIVDGPAKLATLGAFFDRAFASSAELTWDEAIRLLAHLEDDPVATAEQVARLGALLDENGLSEDGAAEERAAFLAAKTGRAVGNLAHLTGREVEAIEALIDGTPATAGGAQ